MEQTRYTGVAIALHWIIGLMIIVNIALAWIWPIAPDEAVRPLINNHKAIGVTVLGLLLMRVLWRWSHPAPALPAHHKPWEKRAAHTVHMLLYVLMFTIPLSGWIMDSAWEKAAQVPMPYFGLFEFPRIGFIMEMDPTTRKTIHGVFGEAHEISGWILMALFVIHVGGALKHQFIDKNRGLARMGVGRAS